MFKLKSATINKYKSYTAEQTVKIDPNITTLVGKKFNHYKPSQCLLGMGLTKDDFSAETLNRFESIFKAMNALF